MTADNGNRNYQYDSLSPEAIADITRWAQGHRLDHRVRYNADRTAATVEVAAEGVDLDDLGAATVQIRQVEKDQA